MGRHRLARRGKFEPVIRLANASGIIRRALLRRLGQVTSAQFCFGIGEQRCDIGVELPRNVLGSRRSIAKGTIVLVKEFVIEAFAQNFTGPLFDFADVNQHSCHWIDRPSEDEVGYVIPTASVERVGLRAESAQVFRIAPMTDVQTPRGRELETLANCEEHESANAPDAIVQGGSASPKTMSIQSPKALDETC